MRKIIIAACILLSGCAGKGLLGNNPEDAGALPSNYQDQIMAKLQAGLKDPESARISIGSPYLSSCRRGVYGTFHGWAVPVTVNAKNSFGAYTGAQTSYAWFAGGYLVRGSDDPDLCPM